jgi:uncharacterized protein (DUF1697 family)
MNKPESMIGFVALLRGVNVGKGKRVPMADWRRQLERLGYAEVATLLNSGNAVFRAAKAPSPAYAAEIAAALERGLKVSTPVVVKSAAEFAAIVRENPLTAKAPNPSRLLVAFSQEAKTLKGLAALLPLAAPPDEFVIGRHAAYLHCPQGSLESKVGAALLGKAGAGVTTRNWATVLKLQALLDPRGA